ncbi:hypothetical protein CN157_09300 [Sinorhizobium meliloti]|uniref:hypothetical protein n=1 Tax=Rhizobium meliloti TaxID=382 RepID=UPI000FDAF617|nr:hypothetical protein [Sinorhizobium meliloti]RVK79373.1 hypothetical protein CN157_09300 [Sinorhizobium meliloti]
MTQEKEQEHQLFRDLIALYHKDITVFAKQVFGSDLTPKQQEFVEAFRTQRTITFRGGVGFGKTHAEAIVTWWALICHDQVQVTLFGPSEPQLRGGIWKELQVLHGRMNPMFKDLFEVGATRIARKVNPSSCFAEYRIASGDKPDNARGIHARNNFVLVDEASGIDDEVYTGALLNILTDENAKLCLVSNPSKASGFFWRTHCDPDIADQWTPIHGRMQDNPRLDPESFERLAKNYGGPTSRQYRVLVEGEFPLSDEDGLIPKELIDFAVGNECFPPDNAPIIWGLDPAGQGADSSVLCIRKDNKVLDFKSKEFDGLDVTQLSYAVRDLYQKLPKNQRPAVISVDANGLGYGVYTNLKDFGLPVYECKFAGSPTRNPDRYSRMRDQIWWEMREWFASENVQVPNNPKMIEELAAPTYEDGTGKIKIEKKDQIKKRLGRSPDFADALALTFAVSPTRYSSKYSWSQPIKYDWLRCYE